MRCNAGRIFGDMKVGTSRKPLRTTVSDLSDEALSLDTLTVLHHLRGIPLLPTPLPVDCGSNWHIQQRTARRLQRRSRT